MNKDLYIIIIVVILTKRKLHTKINKKVFMQQANYELITEKRVTFIDKLSWRLGLR